MANFLKRLRTPNSLAGLLSDLHPQKQKIVIDYSSPNIAKQFHIGNLRSTLLGRYIDKVHSVMGHDVTSINYLGDWGTQFALIAAYWPEMRPSESFWNECSDAEKMDALTSCYVVASRMAENNEQFREKARLTFETMEADLMRRTIIQGWTRTVPTMQLWKNIKDISEHHLKEFYRMFDVSFTHWHYESTSVGRANKVVNSLIEKQILRQTNDGKHVLDLQNNKKSKDAMYAILRKSDNTTLYLSREVATILTRDEVFEADRYLFVVDKAQRRHFEALKEVLCRLNRKDLADKIEHVSYGRVKGLSTRKGRTTAVSEIVCNGTEQAESFVADSKTVKVAGEERKKVAHQLAVSTVVFNDLKRARNAEYEFSFKNAFALNTNNALLLQARHSRLFSIEEQNRELLPLLDSCSTVPEDCDDVVKLLDHLYRLDKVIQLSAERLEPCQLIVHLIEFANATGTVARQLRVKDMTREVAVPRLLLLSACRHALAEGMRLLGLDPVERM